jgi:hypothetical protein
MALADGDPGSPSREYQPLEKMLYPQMGHVNVVNENVVDNLGIQPII